MIAEYRKYTLIFKTPGGTSRGVLTEKETYFLTLYHQNKKGIGECALFRGLSFDDVSNYEEKLRWLCKNINEDLLFLKSELENFPSIWIGLEQALLNLQNEEFIYFPSQFTKGNDSIKINGLIWMGNSNFMKQQLKYKLEENFSCIKLKIGVNWDSEKEIIKQLRKSFSEKDLEIRVDANGAFTFEKAQTVLDELFKMNIHSIEQPIKSKNIDKMASLCQNTPIPIALDEELIGIIHSQEKNDLLDFIKPQYIILKPSLIGGFSGSDEWIYMAEKRKIGWWITSALESNIGLNAITQYTYTKRVKIPQGLGTGGVFTNNLATKLNLKNDRLFFIP